MGKFDKGNGERRSTPLSLCTTHTVTISPQKYAYCTKRPNNTNLRKNPVHTSIRFSGHNLGKQHRISAVFAPTQLLKATLNGQVLHSVPERYHAVYNDAIKIAFEITSRVVVARAVWRRARLFLRELNVQLQCSTV